MELTICTTCQTLRRAGKRLLTFKFSYQDNNNITITSLPMQQSHFSRQNLSFLSKQFQYASVISLYKKTLSFTMNHLTARAMHSTSVNFFPQLSSTSWISPVEIEEILKSYNLVYKKGYTGYITAHEGKCTSKDSLFIDIHTGDATCTKCGENYTWEEFLKFLQSNVSVIRSTPIESVHFDSHFEDNGWSRSIPINDELYKILNLCKPYSYISCHHLELFGVRVSIEKTEYSLLFPYYDITNKTCIAYKQLHINSFSSNIIKNCENLSLFGWNLITPIDKTVVITTTELDSIAITQCTGIPSLALPLSHLPPSFLPFLEQFEKIILWFPNDYKSKENLLCFAKKLNLVRCFAVHKDIGSSLNYIGNNPNESVIDVLNSSQCMAIDRLLTFRDMGRDLYMELLNAKDNSGVSFTRFPLLNDYLKGHRRGELTVFTGPTGSGKTTFLSELSLDLCMQGVNTLWGSFEIKNVRLASVMLHQFSGIALECHMENFADWYERFTDLPMYFMSYFGAQDISCVVQTIEKAVYMYDIEHVVIDNLQFMTSFNTDDDRFQVMDKAIGMFRKCASDLNVHITVVVHPRKENDDAMLQTSSIYGTAKASQEADNVLILQRSHNMIMQVKKNRFNGSIGTIPLSFHPDSLCLSGFYRNIDTGEAVLPELKPVRPIQSITACRRKK